MYNNNVRFKAYLVAAYSYLYLTENTCFNLKNYDRDYEELQVFASAAFFFYCFVLHVILQQRTAETITHIG